MNIVDIEDAIDELNELLAPLIRRKYELEQDLIKAKSLKWFSDNNVNINDIELTDGEMKPYFGNVSVFGKWLYDNNIKKKYCEWNGKIYETEEIIKGQLCNNTDGRLYDLMNR